MSHPSRASESKTSDTSDLHTAQRLLLDDDKASGEGHFAPLFPNALWSTSAVVYIIDCLYDRPIGETLKLGVYVTNLLSSSGGTIELVTKSNNPSAIYHRIEITGIDEEIISASILPQSSTDPPRLVELHFED